MVCGKNIYFTLLLMYETWLMLTVLMFAFAFEVQRNQSREVKGASFHTPSTKLL